MIKFGETTRGFSYGSFNDYFGLECSIQKSSLATDDAIWLGINNPDPKIMAADANQYGVYTTEEIGWVSYPIPEVVNINTRMHLTREQVEALLPILQHFVDTGEVIEKKQIKNPAMAVIEYVLGHLSEDPIEFLRLWNEGDFEAIRACWDNVPDSVFEGAEYGFESTKE